MPAMERSDAVRNRERLLDAARRLEQGIEYVTMEAVAKEAGVGKGTLFRRFGDRAGLLLALVDEAEAEFQEAYTSGPPPLGPGAPAADRLTAFGRTLIERIADDADLGAVLGRQLLLERRHSSDTARAVHRHISTLLREAGVDGDHDMLAHALSALVYFETVDFLREGCGFPSPVFRPPGTTWCDECSETANACRWAVPSPWRPRW